MIMNTDVLQGQIDGIMKMIEIHMNTIGTHINILEKRIAILEHKAKGCLAVQDQDGNVIHVRLEREKDE